MNRLMQFFLITIASSAVWLTFGVQAQTSTPQTLFLTFVPNVQFAPLYMALENGYWAEHGIEVIIEHADEPLITDLIAAGQYQFGVVSGEQVIAARSQARPVVSVYEWFQRYAVGIAYPRERGIETVSDLSGLNIGIPGRFGASYSGLIALLNANGLAETDIDLEEIGFNAPDVVCVGGVEGAVVYLNNEPLQINNRAEAGECGDISGVDVFAVADYADMVSNGLITNEETIRDNPELVRALVEGFDRGLRDVIANPAAAYLVSAEYVDGLALPDDFRTVLQETATALDNMEEDAALSPVLVTQLAIESLDAETRLQMEVLLTTIPLWTADQLGYADPESWETTQSILQTMGFVLDPINVGDAFTNDFLPEEE